MSKSKTTEDAPQRKTLTGKAWDELLRTLDGPLDNPYYPQHAIVNAALRLKGAIRIHEIAKEIEQEYASARAKHAPMRGAHEGYAVLKEEVDELWDEIKAQVPDRAKMRAEALQVAAMALAFVAEVCE